MTALLTDNLPLLAGAPNGIKKLRELILELAVRGKLVPQDPSDEPASELLKRIAEEKARLVAEGKIKKEKPTNEDLAEISYEIPSTWAVASLGQVVEIVRGITFPASEKSKEPEPGRVACLRTANVQDEIEWDDLLYIRESFVSRHDQYVEPHDIVMSMANSRELVGKVALIGAALKQKTTFGGFLGVLRPVLIEPRFVMALLRTPHARSALIDSASQTTNIANVSLGKLRPLPFAIPPLAEQHRIVTKVDELMALCDRLEAQQTGAKSAHAQLVQALLDSLTQAADAEDFAASWQRLAEHFHTLFTTEPSIDALKQSLLRLAVMGKLVPQDSSDEPASELCKSIEAEKRRLVAEKKIKDTPHLEPVSAGEELFALPPSWVWIRMGDICRPITSGSTPSAELFQYDEGIPFLKVYNIRNQEIDFEYKKQFVSPEHHAEKMKRSALVPGDVIMNIVGPPLGKVAIIPDTFPEWNCNQAIVFFGLIAPLSPQYIYTFLTEGSFLENIALIGTAGQDNISVTKSKNIAVPLPPLAEQHRIVTKVDHLMALCDQLKTRLTQARQLNEQLASTLVEQAVV